MGDEELLEFQGFVQELVEALPVEALPVDLIPMHAVGWFALLLRFFARHAYLLAALGAFAETVVLLGFLLPGGTVVALAGAGARTVGLSLPLVVAMAAAGMTGGAVVDYLLGRAGIGQVLRHRWAGRFGVRLAQQLSGAAPLLQRHGWWMMLVAHAFGHGRSSLAVTAGASRLPLSRFLAMEVPAALVWSALYVGGGYYLAAEWRTLELVIRRLGWAGAAAVVVGALVWWYWHRRQQPHRAPAPGTPGIDGEVAGTPSGAASALATSTTVVTAATAAHATAAALATAAAPATAGEVAAATRVPATAERSAPPPHLTVAPGETGT